MRTMSSCFLFMYLFIYFWQPNDNLNYHCMITRLNNFKKTLIRIICLILTETYVHRREESHRSDNESHGHDVYKFLTHTFHGVRSVSCLSFCL